MLAIAEGMNATCPEFYCRAGSLLTFEFTCEDSTGCLLDFYQDERAPEACKLLISTFIQVLMISSLLSVAKSHNVTFACCCDPTVSCGTKRPTFRICLASQLDRILRILDARRRRAETLR